MSVKVLARSFAKERKIVGRSSSFTKKTVGGFSDSNLQTEILNADIRALMVEKARLVVKNQLLMKSMNEVSMINQSYSSKHDKIFNDIKSMNKKVLKFRDIHTKYSLITRDISESISKLDEEISMIRIYQDKFKNKIEKERTEIEKLKDFMILMRTALSKEEKERDKSKNNLVCIQKQVLQFEEKINRINARNEDFIKKIQSILISAGEVND